MLSNPQDGSKMETFFAKTSIEKYLAKLKENDENNAAHFSRYDIRFVKIFTDEVAISKLITLFV